MKFPADILYNSFVFCFLSIEQYFYSKRLKMIFLDRIRKQVDKIYGLESLILASNSRQSVQPNLTFYFVQLLINQPTLFLYAGVVVTSNDTVCYRCLSLPEKINIFRNLSIF